MTNTKPMAKALHTVTVLVRVASRLRDVTGFTPEKAIAEAVAMLGYADAPDPQDLAGKALAQLQKETAA